ncbi:MAG: DUF2970 domain-containing protein [Polaromonas sp.]|nr:DUF2970 domain-containing protein [Polaromonas sp.]
MSDTVKGKSAAPEASFWRSLKTIAWSFFGIRKRSESQKDAAHAGPFHIVVAGLVGVLIIVAGLIVLVNWVVAK